MEEIHKKEIKSVLDELMPFLNLYTSLNNYLVDHNLNKEANELNTLYARYSNQKRSVSEFKEDLDKLWFS